MTTSTLPAPPAAPRQRRWPMPIITLARKMYGDGDAWTPTQIQRYLAEQYGDPPPHVNTIRFWVIPDFAERELARQRDRYWAQRNGREASGLDKQMLELRKRGLSYSAIAIVAELYHGVTLTEYQARDRLRKVGVPPMAGKSKRMLAEWAAKRAAS